MVESQKFNTNEFVPEETKVLWKRKTKHQVLVKERTGICYIKSYCLHEQDKELDALR